MLQEIGDQGPRDVTPAVHEMDHVKDHGWGRDRPIDHLTQITDQHRPSQTMEPQRTVYVLTSFPCKECPFSQTLGVFSTAEKAERFRKEQLTDELQSRTEVQQFKVDEGVSDEDVAV